MSKKYKNIAVVVNNIDYGRQIVRKMRQLTNDAEYKIVTPLTNLTGYRFDGWIDLNGMLLNHSPFRNEFMSRMVQLQKETDNA